MFSLEPNAQQQQVCDVDSSVEFGHFSLDPNEQEQQVDDLEFGHEPQEAHASTDDQSQSHNVETNVDQSNFLLCHVFFCVAIFVCFFYLVDNQTGIVEVMPVLSELAINDNSINIQPNLPPIEPWYAGVVIRPVAFKATTRRPSHH